MQTMTKWMVFSAVALTALLASCSGDDGDDSSGSGGTSTNTSGNGGGGSGSAGKAGSTSAGNSSAGSGTGGKASGGGTAGGSSSAGTGGFTFGGNFNLGGAGFDPDDYACDPAPTPGTACESDAQPCLNGTEVCYCAMAEWACTDITGGGGGAGPDLGDLECPPTKPANGGPCDALGLCPYGGQNEGCACDGSKWTCTP
jgi:hypothetical protein